MRIATQFLLAIASTLALAMNLVPASNIKGRSAGPGAEQAMAIRAHKPKNDCREGEWPGPVGGKPHTFFAHQAGAEIVTAVRDRRNEMKTRNALAGSDESTIAAIDTEYQAAVQKNDVATMDRILADDFVLVTGRGRVYTKADLLKEASDKTVIYERQEDSSKTVRVWGDTAVITALLWAKGSDHGKPFEYRLWFSDTYVRTPRGWRYVFGQSSLPLPSE